MYKEGGLDFSSFDPEGRKYLTFYLEEKSEFSNFERTVIASAHLAYFQAAKSPIEWRPRGVNVASTLKRYRKNHQNNFLGI